MTPRWWFIHFSRDLPIDFVTLFSEWVASDVLGQALPCGLVDIVWRPASIPLFMHSHVEQSSQNECIRWAKPLFETALGRALHHQGKYFAGKRVKWGVFVFGDVSLVECVYPVFITCQMEWSPSRLLWAGHCTSRENALPGKELSEVSLSLRVSPWWSVCTLYLSHARWSYRRRLGWGLCCCVPVQCVTSIARE